MVAVNIGFSSISDNFNLGVAEVNLINVRVEDSADNGVVLGLVVARNSALLQAGVLSDNASVLVDLSVLIISDQSHLIVVRVGRESSSNSSGSSASNHIVLSVGSGGVVGGANPGRSSTPNHRFLAVGGSGSSTISSRGTASNHIFLSVGSGGRGVASSGGVASSDRLRHAVGGVGIPSCHFLRIDYNFG